MSKRWKIRKQNAAKRERSCEVIDQFYSNVIAGLEQTAEQVKAGNPPTTSQQPTAPKKTSTICNNATPYLSQVT